MKHLKTYQCHVGAAILSECMCMCVSLREYACVNLERAPLFHLGHTLSSPLSHHAPVAIGKGVFGLLVSSLMGKEAAMFSRSRVVV